MPVARKSPKERHTLTLPGSAVQLLDRLRGGKPKSAFIQNLLENEYRRRQRSSFYSGAAAAYTPEIQRETLALHDQFPMAEE